MPAEVRWPNDSENLAADVIGATSAGLVPFGRSGDNAHVFPSADSPKGKVPKPLRSGGLSAADLVLNMTAGAALRSSLNECSLRGLGRGRTHTGSNLTVYRAISDQIEARWKS